MSLNSSLSSSAGSGRQVSWSVKMSTMTDAPRAGLLKKAGLRAGPYLARHRRGRNGRVLTALVGAAALGSVLVIGGTGLVVANASSDEPDRRPRTATPGETPGEEGSDSPSPEKSLVAAS